MPATISPIRKRIIKRELRKGKSTTKALKAAGYAKSTALRSTMNKSAKICIAEIESELKTEGKITKEWVERVTKTIMDSAYSKGDYSNTIRSVELISRLAGLLIDKKEIKDVTKDSLWDEFKANRLKKYDE